MRTEPATKGPLTAVTTAVVAIVLGAAVTAMVVSSAAPTMQNCQEWSAEYGLTDQAVVIACETGDDAIGDMTEDEYKERLDASMNEIKRILDETGGL